MQNNRGYDSWINYSPRSSSQKFKLKIPNLFNLNFISVFVFSIQSWLDNITKSFIIWKESGYERLKKNPMYTEKQIKEQQRICREKKLKFIMNIEIEYFRNQ